MAYLALTVGRGVHTGRLSRTLALRQLVLAVAALHGMGPAMAAGSYRKAIDYMRPPGGSIPAWLHEEAGRAEREAREEVFSAWDEEHPADPRLGRRLLVCFQGAGWA